VIFDSKSAALVSIYDKHTSIMRHLQLKTLEYATTRSGAYIFRSDGRPPVPVASEENAMRTHIVKGNLVEEAHLMISKSFQVILRLYKTINHELGKVLEFDYMFRPSMGNRELIVRYVTEIKNDNRFYTDNGLGLLERMVINEHQSKPEANYYPVLTSAILKDNSTGYGDQLTVLTRNACGATSDTGGSLEIMLHRNLQQDDGRGLSERVDDTTTIIFPHWILLDTISVSEYYRKKLSLMLQHPLRMVFDESNIEYSEWRSKFQTSFHPLEQDFPTNVHLLSFQARDEASDDILLRIQHIGEANNSPQIPESLDICRIFSKYGISGIMKVSLNGIYDYDSPYLFPYRFPVDPKRIFAKYGMIKANSESDDKSNRQNSEEDGVFISQAALDNELEQTRKQEKNLQPLLRKLMESQLDLDKNQTGSTLSSKPDDETCPIVFVNPLRNEKENANNTNWCQLPLYPLEILTNFIIPASIYKEEHKKNYQVSSKNQTFVQNPLLYSSDNTIGVENSLLLRATISSLEIRTLWIFTAVGIFLIFGSYIKLKRPGRRNRISILPR